MSLHTISRVRIVRYLYNARTGDMSTYKNISSWSERTGLYIDDLRYRIRCGDYGAMVCSPIKGREFIIQSRCNFEFSK